MLGTQYIHRYWYIPWFLKGPREYRLGLDTNEVTFGDKIALVVLTLVRSVRDKQRRRSKAQKLAIDVFNVRQRHTMIKCWQAVVSNNGVYFELSCQLYLQIDRHQTDKRDNRRDDYTRFALPGKNESEMLPDCITRIAISHRYKWC